MKQQGRKLVSMLLCLLLVISCMAVGVAATGKSRDVVVDLDSAETGAATAVSLGVAALGADAEYQIVEEEGRGKVLQGHTSTGDTGIKINFAGADQRLQFDFKYDAAFTTWFGIYVELHREDDASINHKVQYGIMPSWSPQMTADWYYSASPEQYNEAERTSANYTFETDTWYTAIIELDQEGTRVKVYPAGSTEPAAWNIEGGMPSWYTLEENDDAYAVIRMPDSNTAIHVSYDNISLKELNVSNDVIIDPDKLAVGSVTADDIDGVSTMGMDANYRIEEDESRGHILTGDTAVHPAENSIEIPFTGAQQLKFDVKYSQSFYMYYGLYLELNRVASGQRTQVGITPSWTSESLVLDYYQTAADGSNTRVSGDCTWMQPNTWYTVLTELDADGMRIKIWASDDSEPADWTLTAETPSWYTLTEDEDAYAVIRMNNNSNMQVSFDNISLREIKQEGPYTVTVNCDSNAGSVTGAGEYAANAEATLTATAEDGFTFVAWTDKSGTVSTDNPYKFYVTSNVTLTAVFERDGGPKYTYFTDDFESYEVGAATKDTMPANYTQFDAESNYQIVKDGNNQMLRGTATSVNPTYMFMDCEIIDKEISFDFRYDKDFTSYGGIYVKLHMQNDDGKTNGYYFSMNPNLGTQNLIVSCNETNLGDVSYSFSKNTWYSVKSQLADNHIRVKIWPKGETEPADWNIDYALTGFTPVAEGSYFGLQLFDPNNTKVNVDIDNISMKTWNKLEEKAKYTVTVASSDPTMGTVAISGTENTTATYLDGNNVKIVASPVKGYKFVNWTDTEGNEVSTKATYSFAVKANTTLTANFIKAPVVISSFMAEGLTEVAKIDKTNKTITLHFASDTDLSAVYPYFYLEDGAETEEKPYAKMNLSSGTATIGKDEQQWIITATKNNVMTQFYVSNDTGSDSNNGLTKKTAFKTLEKAQQAIRALGDSWTGDVVVNIACGEYILEDTLAFTVEDSAPTGYAVIWQGATGDANDVTISSGRRLDGTWKQSTDITGLADGLTAWEYDATGLPYSRDLYVDGDLAQLAIYVLDESAVGSWALTDIAEMQMNSEGYLVSGKLADMASWRNPSDIEFVYEVGWTYSIIPVASIVKSGENSQVNMKADAYYCAQIKAGVQIKDPNFIQNCFEGLDSDGEWYYDRAASKIYYITDGDDPNEMDMVMPTLDQLITVDGTAASGETSAQKVHGMTLKDMTFAYTAYLRPHTYGQVETQAAYIVNQDCINWNFINKHDYYLKTDGGITASYTDSMRVSGCVFTNMSASGFDFEEGCTGGQFVGNNLTNLCGNGITIGGVSVRDAQPYNEYTYVNGELKKVGADPDRVTQYNLILSNYIKSVGLRYTGSIGIFAGYVSDTTIAHNTITDASYTGISIGWGWGYWDGDQDGVRDDQNGYGEHHVFDTPSIQARYVVENNDISFVCQRLADGGTVYALSNQPGSRLNGNYMHDSMINIGGVYFDEATGGFDQITNNITYNVYNNYFYHLVGGFTDRQNAMQALWDTGNNYLGVAPTDARADETYKAVMENAGTLDEIAPPTIETDCQHNWGEWVETTAPTTTTEGVETSICSKCGHEKTRPVDKLEDDDHDNQKPGIDVPVVPGTVFNYIKPSFSFMDVAKTDWFYQEVYSAWENGLIDGISSTEYRPEETLTVAQAIKLSAALHQKMTNGKVTLANGTDFWYSTYVDYAVDAGILDAAYCNYTYAQMNAAVTREEFVHILFGAIRTYNEINVIADNSIPDVKSGSKYSNEIYTFYRAGILIGNDAQGTFYPTSSIKRSEVAAILVRMYDTSARLHKTLQ